MSVPKKSRSRLGCLTCRRKKKKCDESLFPVCRNCQYSDVLCAWPEATQNIYPVANEKPSLRIENSEGISSPLDTEKGIQTDLLRYNTQTHILPPEQTGSVHTALKGPEKRDSEQLASVQRRHSHILERIGMQQDCVEEENLGTSFSLTSVEDPVLWAPEQALDYEQDNHDATSFHEFVWPQALHEMQQNDRRK